MLIEPINWQKIVNELLQNRTQKQLQKATGVAQSTISELSSGQIKKRLTYENGASLLKQWELDKAKTPDA